MVLSSLPRARRTAAAAAFSVATAAFTAAPADLTAERRAQDPAGRASARGAAGWVGLQVDFVATSARRARAGDYTVVIADVVKGSPAAEAGVEPGDTLLSINGEEASPSSFEALRAGLRSGDRIELALRGDRGDRRLAVVASVRPRVVYAPASPQVLVRIDSVRAEILRNADALRGRRAGMGSSMATSIVLEADSFVTVLDLREGDHVRLDGVHAGSISIAGEGRHDDVPLVTSWSFRFEEPGTPQAFETFVVHTPRTDSLRASIVQLRDELDRVHRAERRIVRRLAAGSSDAGAPTAATRVGTANVPLPVELKELEMLRTALSKRLEERRDELRAVSKAELEAASPPAPVSRTRVRTVRAEDPPGAIDPPRPVAPHLVGRNYLAGARVTTMNPGLAEYFDVREGVLLTEVAPDTPADELGLEAGDVIVAVDGQTVRDVDQLRARLSSRWIGAVLRIVRMSDTTEVVLGR